jgi:catechol 2,3-dioxygenase-like lactoylglutathione lyase family enzyme
MPANLRRAMIFAKDLERMTRFYRDALGLNVVQQTLTSDWVELDAGSMTLALHAIPDAIASTIEIDTPPRRRGNTPIKLVFEVADFEGARADLIAHGAIMDEPRSWSACDGMDPEGNVFQIVRR